MKEIKFVTSNLHKFEELTSYSLQNQENELMKILTLINQDEIILTEIDPDTGSTIEDVYPKIEEVQNNLRKSRNSLANLIRKG